MAPFTLDSQIHEAFLPVNVYADHFERFLAKKFQASKRFGIEGCESLIPGLFALVEVGA